MKKIFILLLLFFLVKTSFAQERQRNNAEINFEDSTVNYLKFSVDTIDELESIKWNDIKDIFSENKEDKSIELEFEISIPKTKKIHKAKFSFKTKGRSGSIDNLIKKSKKGIKSLIKMTNNFNKQIDEN